MDIPSRLALGGRLPSSGGRPAGARAEPTPFALLCAAVRALAEGAAEPESLIGALLQGAVYVAHRCVTPARHDAVAPAMTRLLADRLDAYGLADGGAARPGCPAD